MRKWYWLLAILLIFLLPFSAAAHSGRTDSNGGHTDHDSGEYHYHHGYPAHSHYDMDGDGDRDCPYEFRNNTGNNTGNNSGNSSGNSSGSSSDNSGLHLKPEYTRPNKTGSSNTGTKESDKSAHNENDTFDLDEFKEDAATWIACLLGITFLLSLVVRLFHEKAATLLGHLGCIFFLLGMLFFGILSIIGWFV